MPSWFAPPHAVEGFPMIPNPKFGLGHAGIMMSDNEPFEQQMKHYSKDHADANGRVCFWMGRIPAVSVSHARDVQHVLKWSSSREIYPLMKVHFEACLGKRNIGILSGKEWKAQRNRVVQALHTAMRQQDVSKAVLQTSETLTNALLQNLSGNSSVTRDIAPLMRMLALDAFGQAALHVDFSCTKELCLSEVAAAFDHLTEDMMRRVMTIGGAVDPTSYLYNLPTPRNAAHKKHKSVVREFIEREVEHRRTHSSEEDRPQDILTQLLKVKEEHIDEGAETEAMTDTLIALLFAGFETTATTLTFAFYLISKHPAVEAEILKEVEEHPPTAESDPSHYPYIEAVLKETLRLYPPAISTTRSLDKPITLDGTVVPEGTYLYVPIYLVQRDPKHFERPDEFLPTRWLPGSTLAVHEDGAFVAFSAGARSCPGRRFACLEMTLSVAVLLRSFRFEAVADYVLEPVRNKMTLEPKGGIPMVITKRIA